MSTDFAELHEMYRSNVFPAMVDVLAEQIGVSSESLVRLGVGWKIVESCWMFPERDADGKIIGLIRRYWDGTKYCEKGSKRGLTFETIRINEGYDPSRQQWKRVTEADPCPICAKPDWCGYDDSTPIKFVRCMRVAEGSVYEDRGAGHIHELIPGAFKPAKRSGSFLPLSDLPVLVVEGATDTAAAMDLGFIAVGKPSARGGLKQLVHLLHGREVVVVGENDAGAGVEGMEKTFEALKIEIPNVAKILPPSDSKDLRDWIQKYDLTQDSLLAALENRDRDSSSDILESKAPLPIAELWLRTEKMLDGIPILRKFHGEWYEFNDHYYKAIDEDTQIRGRLYAFLQDKQVKKFNNRGEPTIEPYDATRSKISDVVDALHMSCPVQNEPPCWLDKRSSPTPVNLICFSNGILDIKAYVAGKTILVPSTPQLFSLTATPYAFDPEAKCPQWLKFLGEIFDDDEERIALLQEWIGYNMVADTSQEKLMLFVGRPASGKSTTLEVLQAVLGHDQYAKSSFKHLCSDFGLQPLMGKLAAIMPDAHVPRQVDATQALETIKSIVGRDGVTVNRKFLPQLPDCVLPCRFTIAVNELPELPDHARSLERRLVLLYFPETFEGREDRTLKDRLPKEAPGIAVWALNGLRRLREQKVFTTPKSSVPVITEFRKFLTPIAEFIDECCESGDDLETHWVPKNQIYDVWKGWSREHGLRPGIRSRFGQRLLAQLIAVTTGRKGLGGQQQYVYFGVKLLPNVIDHYLGRPGGSR